MQLWAKTNEALDEGEGENDKTNLKWHPQNHEPYRTSFNEALYFFCSNRQSHDFLQSKGVETDKLLTRTIRFARDYRFDEVIALQSCIAVL